MLTHPANDFSKKIDKLLTYLNSHLSFSKIMHNRAATIFERLLLSFTVLISLTILYITFFDKLSTLTLLILGLLFILFLISFLSYKFSCIIHVLRTYPEYKMSINPFSSFREFLFIYRTDELKRKIDIIGFSQNDYDGIIEFLENNYLKMRSKFWRPITLITLLAFPFWSELVGSWITKDVQHISILISIFLTLSYFTLYFNLYFERFLLSKAHKYSRASEHIKLLKIM